MYAMFAMSSAEGFNPAVASGAELRPLGRRSNLFWVKGCSGCLGVSAMARYKAHDGDVLMIQGVCRQFWRRSNPVPRRPPYSISKTEIRLPKLAMMCSTCVEKVNDLDLSFVAYVSLDSASDRWLLKTGQRSR